MFENTTGCGGKMGRHDWLLSAMADMAIYAERNGLTKLHQQLCHLVSEAATGELADCVPDTGAGNDDRAANVIQLSSFRQQMA